MVSIGMGREGIDRLTEEGFNQNMKGGWHKILVSCRVSLHNDVFLLPNHDQSTTASPSLDRSPCRHGPAGVGSRLVPAMEKHRWPGGGGRIPWAGRRRGENGGP